VSDFRRIQVIVCALVGTAVFPNWDALAQCADPLTPEKSGDADFEVDWWLYPTVADAVASPSLRRDLFIDLWGLDGDDGEEFFFDQDGDPCPSSVAYESNNCASRRLLNSAIFLEYVQRFGLPGPENTWRVFTDAIDDMDFDHGCDKKAESDALGFMDFYSSGVFQHGIYRRTAIIAHEAWHIATNKWHCGDVYWDPLTLTARFVPDCVCPESATCDPTWDFGGAYRSTAEFIMQALQAPQLHLPAVVRATALNDANFVLNHRFAEHPGFNLDLDQYDTFSLDEFDFEFDSGTIRLAVFPRGMGSSVPVVDLVGVSASEAPGGDESAQFSSLRLGYIRMGFENGHNLTWKEPEFFTVVTTWWSGLFDQFIASTPDSRPDGIVQAMTDVRFAHSAMGDAVGALQITTRELVDGAAIGPSRVFTQPDTYNGTWDLTASAPAGYFLTALGLGDADPSSGYQDIAYRTSIGPQYHMRAGGLGGSANVLKCPVGKIPIGTMQNSVFAQTWQTDVVGYFGLVCADLNWTEGVVNPRGWKVARANYFDEATGQFFAAGVVPYVSTYPQGVVSTLCPEKRLLRGLVVRYGAEIDQIDRILCATLPIEGDEVPVNVGGNGGTLAVQDCWNAPGPEAMVSARSFSPYIYTRSGWRLDALAVGCRSQLEADAYFETEEIGLENPPADVEGAEPWTRNQGMTPSRLLGGATGPSGAAEGAYYMFTEASGYPTGQIYVMQWDFIDLTNILADEDVTLEWSEHLYGAGVGRLEVQVRSSLSSGEWATWHLVSGDQGDQWHEWWLPLNYVAGEVIGVRFVATKGAGYASDIAIDDLRVSATPISW